LFNVFVNVPAILNAKTGEKIKIAPKVIMGVLIASLSLSMLTGCTNDKKTIVNSSITNESTVYNTPNYYEDKMNLSFLDENEDSQMEIDTIVKYPGAGGMISIFDSKYLNEAFGEEEITLDDLYKVIDENESIKAPYSDLIKEYCRCYVENAPNADRRILYHNLKTITIEECNDMKLILNTFSTDAVACYMYYDNKLCFKAGTSFEKGTWEYQILFHELSHAARTAYFKEDGKNYRIRSGGKNYDVLMLDETLNTIFAVGLFDFDYNDFAYHLQSNYMDIIIESMDNYNLEDYINHSQSYFIKKLDEYAGTENYAGAMIELLQAQYEDYHNDEIKANQSEYYPLYDFVSDIFYKSRLNPNMSYEEALAVKEELVNRITFKVPEEYEIDLNHFDEYFNSYCESIGIKVQNRNL
jgi:hypothetical protein